MSKQKDVLYAFIHIPKTAGTTFSKHIEYNLKPENRLRLYVQEILGNKYDQKPYGYKDIEKDIYRYINKLNSSQRKQIKIVYGHKVPGDLQKYFDREVRYFAFFRDPASWVVSLYNHWRTSYFHASSERRNSELLSHVIKFDGKLASFEIWLDHIYKKRKTKGSWTIEDDSLFMYYKLGFNKFFVNQNISRKFASLKNKRIREKIEKLTKSDQIFYEKVCKKHEDLISKSPEYYDVINNMKIKKEILLPFTQIAYDPIGTLKWLKHKYYA